MSIFDVKELVKTSNGLLSTASSVLTLKFKFVLTIVSMCMTPCHCTSQARNHRDRIYSNVNAFAHLFASL